MAIAGSSLAVRSSSTVKLRKYDIEAHLALLSDADRIIPEIAWGSNIASNETQKQNRLSLVCAQPAESASTDLAAEFTDYYQVCHATALAFVQARTSGHPDQEGLVGDTFALAWDKAQQTGLLPDQPWLFQTLRNKIGDWYRRNGRVKEISVANNGLADIEDVAVLKPEEILATEVVRAALGKLEESHREALLLYYWAGQTGPEAAQVAGVSASTFRKRLDRARAAFQNAYVEKASAEGGGDDGRS
jgi:RNA polymerase sigma-70 factor (ECF subfamily)